ncbi:hypothetical protein EJB05_30660, partial [Eragrostis curvula]
MKSIDVSQAVKGAVLWTLQTAKSIERYTFAKTSWAWKGDNGTITKLILPWHISMRLFEMKSTLAFCLDDHY